MPGGAARAPDPAAGADGAQAGGVIASHCRRTSPSGVSAFSSFGVGGGSWISISTGGGRYERLPEPSTTTTE
ncbi:MAG: hypothetical protein DMF50_11415 [Acidobacteria bacterium]|nr:MAG: hypothetical protein DMF50_11415 [Acidobacteriota bacterium]